MKKEILLKVTKPVKLVAIGEDYFQWLDRLHDETLTLVRKTKNTFVVRRANDVLTYRIDRRTFGDDCITWINADLHCVACGEHNDRIMNATSNVPIPSKGDYSLCAKCGQVYRYNAQLNAKPISIDAVESPMKSMVQQAQAAVKRSEEKTEPQLFKQILVRAGVLPLKRCDVLEHEKRDDGLHFKVIGVLDENPTGVMNFIIPKEKIVDFNSGKLVAARGNLYRVQIVPDTAQEFFEHKLGFVFLGSKEPQVEGVKDYADFTLCNWDFRKPVNIENVFLIVNVCEKMMSVPVGAGRVVTPNNFGMNADDKRIVFIIMRPLGQEVQEEKYVSCLLLDKPKEQKSSLLCARLWDGEMLWKEEADLFNKEVLTQILQTVKQ